jgi:hypothetical protein
MTAHQAIDRSISHDEIVTIDHDPAVLDALVLESEDWVKTDTRYEFWGRREAGAGMHPDPWRVHVRLEK